MAILNAGSLNPHGAPVLRRYILTNSIVTTAGDSMKLASGFAALGTTGASVLGHAINLSTNAGVGVNSSGAAGAELGSFLGTYTAASDNQTVANVKAEMDISKETIYSAEVDAAIGTTTGSNLAGYFMDLSDEDTLDEDTAATTTGQYATHGVDPANSAKALVTVFESVIFGPLA